MKGRGAGSGGALDVGTSLADGRLRYFDSGPGYLACLASTDPITEINVIHPPEDLWTT